MRSRSAALRGAAGDVRGSPATRERQWVSHTVGWSSASALRRVSALSVECSSASQTASVTDLGSLSTTGGQHSTSFVLLPPHRASLLRQNWAMCTAPASSVSLASEQWTCDASESFTVEKPSPTSLAASVGRFIAQVRAELSAQSDTSATGRTGDFSPLF